MIWECRKFLGLNVGMIFIMRLGSIANERTPYAQNIIHLPRQMSGQAVQAAINVAKCGKIALCAWRLLPVLLLTYLTLTPRETKKSTPLKQFLRCELLFICRLRKVQEFLQPLKEYLAVHSQHNY